VLAEHHHQQQREDEQQSIGAPVVLRNCSQQGQRKS